MNGSVPQISQISLMDERRLAEQFAQTGNLMDLCASEDWLKELAQVEADCGGSVEAGLALREYAARLGAPTVQQLQMVKLHSTLFSELHAWMESWQLGLSFETTYTEARRLIRHRLQNLSSEQSVSTPCSRLGAAVARGIGVPDCKASAILGRHCSRTASRRMKSPAGAVELLVVGLAMW